MKTRMNFKDEFYQKLKLLVLPIAIQNFMLALVSATDAIMLGWIDQTSLSAVSLAGQVQFVLSLFISGIAAGAGIMAAQYWGKQDAASIEKVIPIALRTNLLFSGLFTILAGFCPEMLMRIFTNDAALVASGSQYLRAVALSYVLCGISQVYLILLKNTGHAAVSSRISSTAVVLNIILNAILIYGLCGAPALGIRGAAYATVAARVVELIWAYLETKKPERVRILWNRLFSSAGKILSEDFWRYTLPVLAASLVWGIAYVLYSVIMGHMGSDAVAANSITSIAKSLLSCLIRGVTGSGKTLVYMELMERVLKEGKQVIVLIPEIALTYQNVERFCARFGTRVTVVNSRMTPSERADQMERARRGEVSIMIGPRSALFAPFPDLGLIVIDEEHETSYKSEVTPRYHARETAVRRAGLEHAHVVMGSATPSVDASYACETGAYALFRMDARYGNAALPSVWIADMREELQMGNRSILSGKLREEIEKRLEKKEQVVLFLNRRGYAGFVSCRACGYVMKCPHCDVSLTAHNNGKLVCHYCGYETPQVHACPSCGSPYIGGFRAGTQQIEQNVKKLFPKARVLRMDGDTTKTKNSYEEILSSFAAGEADILIGTQMIVKGHDFPNVTLVGALAADLSLNAVDYRAGERTFQLLTQAVGRAGRGEKPGMAVIQTYHPEHYSIQTAAEQDYRTFYEKEMDYRRLMGYPPAAELLAIHGAGEDEAHLTQAMEYIRRYLIRIRGNREVQIIGPASEAVSKINDLYRMAVYVRAPQEEVLAELREKLERYIEINKGFRTVYLQFDFSRKY